VEALPTGALLMPKGKGKSGPIMLDIKIRYVGKEKPTEEMVVDCLEHMLATGGDVPDNFQFAAIDWTRPGTGTHGFRSGSVSNFAQFAPLIRAKLGNLKVRLHRKPGNV
jgi:hypothetical protein